MNIFKTGLCLALLALLQGCFNGDISKAKELKIGGSGPTYATALGDFANCDSLKWASSKDERGNRIVTATCTLDPKLQVKEWLLAYADKNLTSMAASMKVDYGNRLTTLERHIARAGNSLASQTGAPGVDSGTTEYQRDQAIVDGAIANKDAYMAQIDERKIKDLEANRQLIESGEILGAEYKFAVTDTQAGLVGLNVMMGGKRRSIPHDEAARLVFMLPARNPNAQATWFMHNLSELVSSENLNRCARKLKCDN